jgi:hypothetical protein
MPNSRVDALLASIKSLDSVTIRWRFFIEGREVFSTTIYTNSLAESEAWRRMVIEEQLDVTLPEELVSLWESVSSIRLFEDTAHGQWGLLVWSPSEVLRRNPEERRAYRGSELRDGDLIIGEFLGDLERVLVRCDQESNDFGRVLIVAELDRRRDWCIPAASVLEFLEGFVASYGQKYWEPKTRECPKCKGGMPVAASICPHCGEKQF